MLATSASLPIARASGTSRASPKVRRPSLASSHESVSSGSRRSLRGVPAASAVASDDAMRFCDAGVETPPLGLGLAALGRPGYINLGHDDDLPRKDVEEMRAQAHAVLDTAWAAGVRYFDAARSYGLAEDFLSSWLALRDVPSADVVVGSKWGYTYSAKWRVDNGDAPHEIKEHTAANFEVQWPQTLSLLGSHLRLYQIHSATFASGVLRDAEVLARLARARDETGVRVGLSLSGAEQAETLRAALAIRTDTGARLFDCAQATWNVMEQSAGDALLEAREEGVDIIVKEALANGRLTRRNENEGASETIGALKRVGEAFAEPGETPFGVDAVALAIAMNAPFRPMVLSGAATEAHAASNVRALELLARFRAEPEKARTLTNDALELGRMDPGTYWAERAALAWN